MLYWLVSLGRRPSTSQKLLLLRRVGRAADLFYEFKRESDKEEKYGKYQASALGVLLSVFNWLSGHNNKRNPSNVYNLTELWVVGSSGR